MCFAVLTHSQDNMERPLGASSSTNLWLHRAETNSPCSQAWCERVAEPQSQLPVPLQLSKITIRKPWNTSVGQTKLGRVIWAEKNWVKQNQIWFAGPLPKRCCCTEQDCSENLGETRCFLIAASDGTLIWGTGPSQALLKSVCPERGVYCHISQWQLGVPQRFCLF